MRKELNHLKSIRITIAIFALLTACSSSSVKDYTAAAGQSCHDCDQCCTIGSCCVCDSCSDFAFDPTNKQLLMCDAMSQKWRVANECPGGGYARCVDGHSQRTSCIGADGGQSI